MVNPIGASTLRTEPQAVRHPGPTRNEGNGANRAPCNPSDSVVVSQHGAVTLVRLSRPAKRNAIDTEMVAGIETIFSSPPRGDAGDRPAWRRRAIFAPAPIWPMFAEIGRGGRDAPVADGASGPRPDRVWRRAGRRGIARRCHRWRPGNCRSGAYPGCRTERLLRAAGGHARNFRWRRRFRASSAAHRHRPHDRHDADRTDLRCSRRRGARLLAICGRGWARGFPRRSNWRNGSLQMRRSATSPSCRRSRVSLAPIPTPGF